MSLRARFARAPFSAVGEYSRINGRHGRTDDFSGRNPILILAMNSGMRCIGAVPVFPVRTKVSANYGDFTLPFALDPLHCQMNGREFKFRPHVCLTERR